MKKFARGAAVLLVCLLITVSSVGTFAAGKIDLSRSITLNISYTDEMKAIPKAGFSIFKVADVDEYARLTLTGEFKTYEKNVSGLADPGNLTPDEWTALASTLGGYVKKDKISPAAEGKTDDEGNLAVSDLKAGLYLVTGKNVRTGDYVYSIEPFFVFLPAEDPVNNDRNYDVTVAPKFTKDYSPEDEFIIRKVLKIWNDEGSEDVRPSEVTVRLLKDGKEYDAQTLNEDNGWSFKWEKLNSDYDWDLVEDEIDGYTSSVSKNGITFAVTNTYSGQEPGGTDQPEVPQTPDAPDTPDNPGGSTSENDPNGGTLPQTGQLWWPVLLLAAAGLAAVIIGLTERRREECLADK